MSLNSLFVYFSTYFYSFSFDENFAKYCKIQSLVTNMHFFSIPKLWNIWLKTCLSVFALIIFLSFSAKQFRHHCEMEIENQDELDFIFENMTFHSFKLAPGDIALFCNGGYILDKMFIEFTLNCKLYLIQSISKIILPHNLGVVYQ